ncbi:MAG: nitrous oxide reductase family maturation protein NosD [Promethearchaeota archaeon]
MKPNRKINRGILLFFGITLIFSSLIFNNPKFYTTSGTKIVLDNDSLELLEISGKIHINNNWSDAELAGICNGLGTYSDPYIIEGLEIDGGGLGSCILIENSTAYFKIIDCLLYNSGTGLEPSTIGAITLFNVSNGLITQNNCTSNDLGIIIVGSNNSISHNFITENQLGIFSIGSNYISGNNINGNLGGIGITGEAEILLNNITNNEDFGIMLFGAENSSVIRNYIYNNNKDGIKLLESRYNNISKNECNNNKNCGICLDAWWDFPSCRYNWISENIVNNNLYGITFNYAEYNQFVNNEVKNNQFSGILLGNSNYNNISKNHVEDNDYGISINASQLNDFIQNTINYNDFGIFLTFSCQNVISHNILHYNRVCIKDDDYCYNYYEENDCINIGDKKPNLILPMVVTGTILLGLALTLFTYLRYKKK